MTDIVERWKDELDSLGGKPMNTAEHYANDMAGIIETLRQRVKELEDAADEYKQLHGFAVNGFNRLTEELAALKQNGEPVAWYNSREIGSFITFSKVEHDKWPNLYNVALYAAPQTCYSAGDMADAAAKAAQVEREECWRTAENHDTGAQAAKAIRMRGEETK